MGPSHRQKIFFDVLQDSPGPADRCTVRSSKSSLADIVVKGGNARGKIEIFSLAPKAKVELEC